MFELMIEGRRWLMALGFVIFFWSFSAPDIFLEFWPGMVFGGGLIVWGFFLEMHPTTQKAWVSRLERGVAQGHALLQAHGMTLRRTWNTVGVGSGRNKETFLIHVLCITHSVKVPFEEDECFRKDQSGVKARDGIFFEVPTIYTPRLLQEGIGAPLKNADFHGSPLMSVWIQNDPKLSRLIEGLCDTHTDVHIGHDFVELGCLYAGVYDEGAELSIELALNLIQHMEKESTHIAATLINA